MPPPPDSSPAAFRVDHGPDRTEVALPLDVPSSYLRGPMVMGTLGATLAVVALGGGLFVSGLDVGIALGSVGVAVGGLAALVFAFASRVQPTLWWPQLLGQAMPVLVLTRHSLTLRDSRGTLELPLESIHQLDIRDGAITVVRASGTEVLARGLRPDEADYLKRLVEDHASRVREAVIREGASPDARVRPPQALSRMTEGPLVD